MQSKPFDTITLHDTVAEGDEKVKFDVVVGNPPYQNQLMGGSTTRTPIYHFYMDIAYSISEKSILITPARFLFNAGYTSKEWNKKMLNDTRLRIVSYFSNSGDVFQDVDIKGGLVITDHDSQRENEAILLFKQYDEINGLIEKIYKSDSFISLKTIIVTSFAYHFTDQLYIEHPDLSDRASKGHKYDLQSNAFSVFPEIFYDEIPDDDDYIRILGKNGKHRCWKFVKRNYVSDVKNLTSYKVFYAKAAGTGQYGEVLPDAIFGGPNDGATVTYISVGIFSTPMESENCAKYLKTKFVRALLGILKVTQDNTPGKWEYVPLQDFTAESDIDWSKPISEIDIQLYDKYGLTDDEIAFIESKVAPME